MKMICNVNLLNNNTLRRKIWIKNPKFYMKKTKKSLKSKKNMKFNAGQFINKIKKQENKPKIKKNLCTGLQQE